MFSSASASAGRTRKKRRSTSRKRWPRKRSRVCNTSRNKNRLERADARPRGGNQAPSFYFHPFSQGSGKCALIVAAKYREYREYRERLLLAALYNIDDLLLVNNPSHCFVTR